MKLLKKIVPKIFYSMIGFSSLNAYSSSCTIYEHNISGYSISMNNGDYIPDLTHIMIQRRSWHGYLFGWRGSDRNFNDAASSVTLEKGCSLRIYEHIHRGGRENTLYNENLNVRNRHFNEVSMNEAASSLECVCNFYTILTNYNP